MICRSAHQGWLRALVKTALYRALTLVATVAVAWYLLDDPSAALNVGVALTAVKTVLYLFYERAWDHITWGMRSSAQ